VSNLFTGETLNISIYLDYSAHFKRRPETRTKSSGWIAWFTDWTVKSNTETRASISVFIDCWLCNQSGSSSMSICDLTIGK